MVGAQTVSNPQPPEPQSGALPLSYGHHARFNSITCCQGGLGAFMDGGNAPFLFPRTRGKVSTYIERRASRLPPLVNAPGGLTLGAFTARGKANSHAENAENAERSYRKHSVPTGVVCGPEAGRPEIALRLLVNAPVTLGAFMDRGKTLRLWRPCAMTTGHAKNTRPKSWMHPRWPRFEDAF